MRSSKSRSRSKSNRPRTIGNIINRVFDSSGPEGKVRGTPQQIIDKYLILARDAQLSNDRVAAENFQQHAEHYTRMLGEAMREMAAEQDQRQPVNGQNGNQNGNQSGNSYGQNAGYRDRPMRDDPPEALQGQRAAQVIELDDGDDSNLVETPETRSRAETSRNDYVERAPQADRPERTERPDRGDRQERRSDRPRFAQNDRREDRRPAQTDPAPQNPPEVAVTLPLSPMMPSFVSLPEAGPAEAKPAAVRRPRAPRKPKATDGSSEGGPAEAAE